MRAERQGDDAECAAVRLVRLGSLEAWVCRAGTAVYGGFAEQRKIFAGQMKWDGLDRGRGAVPVHPEPLALACSNKGAAVKEGTGGGVGDGWRRRRQNGSTV